MAVHLLRQPRGLAGQPLDQRGMAGDLVDAERRGLGLRRDRPGCGRPGRRRRPRRCGRCPASPAWSAPSCATASSMARPELSDLVDARPDRVGRAVGGGRQRFDLGGDDGEAAPGLAGARRLDRRVQRQQIGLRREAADQLDDAADALIGLLQHGDVVGDAAAFGAGLVGGAGSRSAVSCMISEQDAAEAARRGDDLGDGGRDLLGPALRGGDGRAGSRSALPDRSPETTGDLADAGVDGGDALGDAVRGRRARAGSGARPSQARSPRRSS